MDAAEGAAQIAETALWERLRASGKAEDIEAFLRLYPDRRFATAARRRRDELVGRPAPPVAAARPQAPVAGASPQPAPAPVGWRRRSRPRRHGRLQQTRNATPWRALPPPRGRRQPVAPAASAGDRGALSSRIARPVRGWCDCRPAAS